MERTRRKSRTARRLRNPKIRRRRRPKLPYILLKDGWTALVAKFDEADRLYIVTVKYTGVEKTDGEIKAKYNEKIDFIDFELDGYTYKVTKGGAEITELTVKGDDEITVTYEKKADPKPTESEDLSESGNDSETNKPTGSESIKDSKTEEKSGCFGNVAGASAGVFAALIAAVAILRKRR